MLEQSEGAVELVGVALWPAPAWLNNKYGL